MAVTAATADGVCAITLDAPPVNALSTPVVAELHDAVRAAAAPGVRAVVITSAVDRVFMAGADLTFLRSAPLPDQRRYVADLQAVLRALEALPVPVVAGVDGAALGGGVELLLCADVCVASPGARFGLPEVQLGLLPAAGGVQRLVRAVGLALARDLLLTGRRLDGEQAVACGLVSRGAPPGAAGDAARALAVELTRSSPEALAATKRLALAAPDVAMDAGLAAELDAWTMLRAGRNAGEGIAAFAERRAPQYEPEWETA